MTPKQAKTIIHNDRANIAWAVIIGLPVAVTAAVAITIIGEIIR